MRTYPLAQAVHTIGWDVFVTDVTELHANGVSLVVTGEAYKADNLRWACARCST